MHPSDEAIEVRRPPVMQSVSSVLHIASPAGLPPAGTVGFEVITPCQYARAESLPVDIDVGTCDVESVTLPVIVAAVGAPDPSEQYPLWPTLAYAAGTAISDGVGGLQLLPSAWSTACARVTIAPESTLLYLRFRPGGALFSPDLSFCMQGAGERAALDFGEGLVAHASAGNALLHASYAVVPQSIVLDEFLSVSTLIVHRLDDSGAAWSAETKADLVVATTTWLENRVRRQVRWDFVLPSSASAFTVPEVPHELGMQVIAEHGLQFTAVDASWIDSVDAAHHALPALLMQQHMPPEGTVRATTASAAR